MSEHDNHINSICTENVVGKEGALYVLTKDSRGGMPCNTVYDATAYFG